MLIFLFPPKQEVKMEVKNEEKSIISITIISGNTREPYFNQLSSGVNCKYLNIFILT